MSEFFKQAMEHSSLLQYLPFLIINRNGDGRIGIDVGEVVKTLVTAGIIALVVGYGTVRVLEKEQESFKEKQTEIQHSIQTINVKVDQLMIGQQATNSERAVRRLEIDRRLDMLERKK